MVEKFIIGAIVVLALLFIYSRHKKIKAYLAFNALDEAEPWFSKEKIVSSSVVFSTYIEPELAKNSGASVLAGVGDKTDGSRVGFVLEVIDGSGVVESAYIEPHGFVITHRILAEKAKTRGEYLIDLMQEGALKWRLENE